MGKERQDNDNRGEIGRQPQSQTIGKVSWTPMNNLNSSPGFLHVKQEY